MSNESGYHRYTLDDAEDHIVRLQTEITKLKEENDHLDNVIQGLHHDLDVLRKI